MAYDANKIQLYYSERSEADKGFEVVPSSAALSTQIDFKASSDKTADSFQAWRDTDLLADQAKKVINGPNSLGDGTNASKLLTAANCAKLFLSIGQADKTVDRRIIAKEVTVEPREYSELSRLRQSQQDHMFDAARSYLEERAADDKSVERQRQLATEATTFVYGHKDASKKDIESDIGEWTAEYASTLAGGSTTEGDKWALHWLAKPMHGF